MSPSGRLLCIVSVPPEGRVQCQQPGCGHGVYAAVHIVEDGGQLHVLGSTCFAKRYGSSEALGKPAYVGGGGGMLTDEERQLLKDNTAALIAHFKSQHEIATKSALDKLHALRSRFALQAAANRQSQQRLAPRPPAVARRPWPWQHDRNTSVAVFRSSCGQSWVRVQHKDGTHKLVPWPMFDGWDEALPPSCGAADQGLQAYSPVDVPTAFATLKKLGMAGPIVGIWPEVIEVRASKPMRGLL